MKTLEDVVAVEQFRLAAIADGWVCEPLYDGEPVEQAWTLEREGFRIMGINRPFFQDLAAWGSDGLHIGFIDLKYPGFEYFQQHLRWCPHCGAKDVQTFRFSFAGRACKQCLPQLRREYEKPRWAN